MEEANFKYNKSGIIINNISNELEYKKLQYILNSISSDEQIEIDYQDFMAMEGLCEKIGLDFDTVNDFLTSEYSYVEFQHSYEDNGILNTFHIKIYGLTEKMFKHLCLIICHTGYMVANGVISTKIQTKHDLRLEFFEDKKYEKIEEPVTVNISYDDKENICWFIDLMTKGVLIKHELEYLFQNLGNFEISIYSILIERLDKLINKQNFIKINGNV